MLQFYCLVRINSLDFYCLLGRKEWSRPSWLSGWCLWATQPKQQWGTLDNASAPFLEFSVGYLTKLSLLVFFPSSPGIQCGPDQASVVETRATDFDQALALCEIVLVHQESEEILRHNPCPQRVYHLFGKIRHKNMKSKSLMKDLNDSSRQW